MNTNTAPAIHNPILAKGLIGAMRTASAANEALQLVARNYVHDYLASRGVFVGGRVTANRNQAFVLNSAHCKTYMVNGAERISIEYSGRLVKADKSVSAAETALYNVKAPDGNELAHCLTLAAE